jgi:hypothetical protein
MATVFWDMKNSKKRAVRNLDLDFMTITTKPM